MTVRPAIFTIGHSNHSIDRFIELLRLAGVTAVADIRSTPFSRWVPHFSRPALERHLTAARLDYMFLGEQLGGRPRDKSVWRDGRVDYGLIAATASFQHGLDRVQAEASRRRLALMCAERDPLDCHRFLLVGRQLAERGANIRHVLADGTLEDHGATERREPVTPGVPDRDLFA
ncbi:MAG: DUF488 family protein [Dongiaceae bacterium]